MYRRLTVGKTFVLVHGAGDVGWYGHLVEQRLRDRGHDVVAPDLPCDDDNAGLEDYVRTVEQAIGDRDSLVVVGQSFGGYAATLLAARRPVRALVLVAAMVPAPGERPDDWFANTGWEEALADQARRDEGRTGSSDPPDPFYHDVPDALAEEARTRERYQSPTPGRRPWPLDAWPDVPTRFVLCSQDRFFPAAFMRRVVADRLGIVPDEIAAGHCVALSRPHELADLLDSTSLPA